MQYNSEERLVEMEYKLSYVDYVEGLKQGRLLGLKCNQCGAYAGTPKKVCPVCRSEDMEVVELSGKGTVQTFTVVRVPPEGFENEVPYIIAEVELGEGVWVMGNVVGVDPDKVDLSLIGRKVKVGEPKIIPGDKFSGGSFVALTLDLNGDS
jgi:hypothetical protein